MGVKRYVKILEEYRNGTLLEGRLYSVFGREGGSVDGVVVARSKRGKQSQN